MVELYQIYTTNTAANGFCAMYTIEVPYIELDKTELEIVEGDGADLTASVGISTMEDKSVTWTSSNPDVATVDAQGHVVAVAPGTATITAKSNGNGLTATCEVTVLHKNPVTALALDKSEISIIRGFSETLTAIFTPEDAPIKTLTWTSSNPEVATVDAEGIVTAVEVGEATITATAHTGVSATCTVTVIPPVEVSEIVMSKTELTLARSDSETLTATVLPENATYPDVTWSSSDPSVASVNQEGLVNALKVGTAEITATATNGVTATCTVTVNPSALDIVSAQLTVTQNWIKQGLPGGNNIVRSGSGVNGKFYLPAANELYVMDETGFDKVLETDFDMDKGLALDEAGNIIVAGFPTNSNSWKNVHFISADFSTVTPLTLSAPSGSEWSGNRYDMVGNAIGDFTSEEGGLYFITSSSENYPIPVWIKNGEPVELKYATDARFNLANSTATAMPSVTSMADVTAGNVADLFYYRTPQTYYTQIGYVDEAGNAAYLATPKNLPSGWNEKNQNGFAVFSLNGVRLQVRMAGPAAWTNNWVVSNDEGNVIYSQNYVDTDYAPTGALAYGCNMIARQINPYKVELYQIYATTTPDKGFCALYTVEVPHILLDKSAVELYTSQTAALTATLGTSQMEDKSITWTSSDPEVATVDEEGNITGVSAGTATITATSNGNGLSASCEVTVLQAIEVTSVTLNEDDIEIIEGETKTLEATVLPEDATFPEVTWSSADPEIAIVDEEGHVTALVAGSTIISASTSNGVSATCSVTVKEKPTGVDAVSVGNEVCITDGVISAAAGVEVRVFDIAGRLVATTVGGNISGLAKGVYIVSVPGKTPLKVEL